MKMCQLIVKAKHEKIKIKKEKKLYVPSLQRYSEFGNKCYTRA